MGASAESRVGFGLRLVSSLIDAIIMTVGGVAVGLVFGGALGAMFGGAAGTIDVDGQAMSGTQVGGMVGALAGAVIALPLVGFIYALLEAFTGATLGKMLLGFKVGAADGTKAGLGQLFWRFALKNGAFLCAMAAGLVGIELFQTIGSLWGAIWFFGCFLALTQARQGLHDKLSGTAVYPSKVLK